MPRQSSLPAPLVLALLGLLLWCATTAPLVQSQRVRGLRQVRTLLDRNSLPDVKYARLIVQDENDEGGSGTANQYRRRLPPKKVSKKCNSKSLKSKSGKSGGKSEGSNGKSGKSSKSNTDASKPSCDTETAFCSCPACTQEVLDRKAGEYTCGARMEYLLENYAEFAKTRQACARVAGLEFPAECGECDPFSCEGRKPVAPEFYCGCAGCNEKVWGTDTGGGYTCGARISWSMIVDRTTQNQACTLVANSHDQCKKCDPKTCSDRRTPAPTVPVPTVAPSPSVNLNDGPTAIPGSEPITTDRCGCPDCAQKAWDTVADNDGGNSTCGMRISWLVSEMGESEEDACRKIAGSDGEFPDVCGPACDPDRCGSTPTASIPTAAAPVPSPTGINPTANVPTAPQPSAPQPTAPRPTAPQPTAPQPTAPLPTAPLPTAPQPTAPQPTAPQPTAPQPTAPQPSAPQPSAPQPSAPQPSAPVASPITEPNPTSLGSSPTPAPVAATPTAPSPTSSSECPALTPEMDLYCFKNYSDRVRYEDVWGSYIVEVKADPNDSKCAPNDNRFADDNVVVENDGLTLRFKNKGNGWTASEVRIVLPDDEMPYTYGQFDFSVKSVTVKNRTSGETVDYTLPVDVVLGMFTWDPRLGCEETKYTNNHEVDIEISRWGGSSGNGTNMTMFEGGNATNGMDGLFVVQPMDPLQYLRFFTGTNKDYDQGGHTYSFYWHPTNITWETTAGGGLTFSYTTEEALAAGQPDRIQCLPANIDVRINLWNFNQQATDVSTGLSDDLMVEVIIDRFSFTPSGETGVGEGAACSKDCQCEDGLSCSSGVCAA